MNTVVRLHGVTKIESLSTPKLIGAETMYVGSEISWAYGYRARILRVLSNCAWHDKAPDEVSDDEGAILSEGGVTANDRLDVHFQRPDGMWLTVLSFQPRAVDLELFADVKAEWMEDQRQKFEWFVQETQKLARRHC